MGICGMALSMGEALLYSGVPRIIEIKITPTLKQLKKRPALWVCAVGNARDEPRITMPDGTCWAYDMKERGWALYPRPEFTTWFKFSRTNYDFAGWL